MNIESDKTGAEAPGKGQAIVRLMQNLRDAERELGTLSTHEFPAGREADFILLRESLEKLLRNEGLQPHVAEAQAAILDALPARTTFEVAEHKLTGQKLRESEESYRMMFESNPHPMWVYDHATFKFLAVNQAAVVRYGYTREEFLHLTIKDIRPAEDQARLENAVRNLPEGMRVSGLWRHRVKDGSIIQVEITSHSLNYSGRRAQLVLALDVTERVTVEQEIERQAAFVRFNPHPVVELSAGGKINYYNDATEVMAHRLRLIEVEHILPPDLRKIATQCLADNQPRENQELNLANRIICWSFFPVLSLNVIHAYGVDITERRTTENALRESEERVRATFDSAPTGIAILNLAGRYLLVNPAYCQTLGYSEDELMRMHFQAITHPDDLSHCWQMIRDLQAKKMRVFTADKRYVRKDEKIVWVRASLSLIRDQAGQPCRLIAVTEDISERKATEEKLSQSQALIKFAGRAAHLGGWMLELAENRLVWSDETCAIHDLPAGYQPSFEEGLAYFPAEYQPTVLEHIRACRESGIPYDLELPKYTAKGRKIWVRTIGEAVRDAEGRIVRLQGAFQDITERKKSGEKLEQGESLLREQASLLDKAQDAILVHDLDHCLTYWNKSCERLYGWKAEAVMGKSVPPLIYRDTKKFELAIAQVMASGEWTGELNQVGQGNRDIIVEGHWTLVRDHQGVPKSILCINTDITDKKKIEAQFLRTQRMESIGTMAGGIAHDLNNILAPILLVSEMLEFHVKDQEGRAFVQNLKGCALRGSALVRQVLTFARGMGGERIPTNLNYLGRDIHQMIQDTFPKNIESTLQTDRELWPILGDPTQLHQVLLNLCVNARDAMPKGGKLAIQLKNIRSDEVVGPEVKPGPYVLLSVTDTGVGIPPEIRDRIFEPFFTTKEVTKGTGLGLSTVFSIIKNHEGFINLYSEVGKGTTFNVYLPAQSIDKPAMPVDPGPPPALLAGRNELILLVDDEEPIRTVAESILKRLGYRVVCAANGAEAITAYVKHSGDIAVVITDMAMPIMDGPALITILKMMNPNLKIIVSSGFAVDTSFDIVRKAGVRHFIHKPYTSEALLKTICDAQGQAA